jgi:Protein of unknown function (DUF3999)
MKLSRTILLILSSSLLAQPVLAADFRFQEKVDEQGELIAAKPFYRSDLPIEVYQATRSSTLHDLTITNAVGEQVPYALVPYDTLHPETTTQKETIQLQFSPIKINALQNPNELRLQLEKSAEKTTINLTSSDMKPTASTVFLIDLGIKHPPISELLVDWQGDENTLHNIQVLSSADLKDWTIAGDATLLSTLPSSGTEQQQLKTASDQNGTDEQAQLNHTISQHTIKLNNNWDDSNNARYLQIRPYDAADTGTITLTQVRANYDVLQTVAPQPLWQEPHFIGRANQDKSGLVNIDFESFGHFPTSRLKVKLPQANTVTNVTFLVRNATNEPWKTITSTSLRSLADGKPYPPEILWQPIDARFWRLQFDQSGGGIGTDNPTLNLGWLPNSVVWNARGKAPFTLHVGDNPSIVNTIPITTMLPEYDTQHINALPVAFLKPNAATQSRPVTTPAGTWVSPPDYKIWLLWGGLVLGVLLLAGMAYSLLKAERKK